MGAKLLPRCNVRYVDDWERVSIESSRNAEDTTRGALVLFHQSLINRWSLFRR